ncbi:MAG: TetR/AcrR family transcriptional regulator [Thiobacillus sp.]|nr:TetR/AcrR family transcriptional regulator [Thiobacillus sp.]MDP1923557.1 TetR/AcrR family transcriptional regulator [Thiobacillus sp.]MDP3126777.1 TetR/AcrR family transcriptional regulator [Thiobacillus sp.]
MLSKGDKTRAEIVEHAKSLFYERGYDGTSFTDIVNAVGVYRGNINYYFKTKDDILKAVIDRHLEEFGALLAEWTARHADPRDRLIDFVHMIAERQAALTRYGCPIGTLNTELGKDRPELQRSARALFDLFKDWLAEQFRALGSSSDEAIALALHLLGRAQGVAVIAHVYQDTVLLQREVAQMETWIRQFSL